MTRLSRVAACLALALPVFLSFNYVYRFGISVPYWDEWALVPMFAKWRDGTLTFTELLSLSNEHRLFFPRLVLLITAQLTSYNVHAMMYVGWVILFGTGALLLFEHMKTFGSSLKVLWIHVPLAWLLFSVHQYENLLWGWQVQFFIVIFSVVAASWFLQTLDRQNWRLAAALALAVVSSFSLAGGLGVWPAGAAHLLALHFIRRKSAGRRYLVFLGIWLAVAAAVVAVYAHGYTSVPGMPSQTYFIDNPMRLVRYVFVALGGPISGEPQGAFTVGVTLVSVLVLLGVALRQGQLDAERAAFGIPLMVFALAFVGMIAIGRGAWGDGSALSSRYTTIAAFFAIGVFRASSALTLQPARWALCGVMAVFFGLCLNNFFQDSYRVGWELKAQRSASAEILRDWRAQPDEALQKLFANPALVKEGAQILEAQHLNVFEQAQ